MSVVWRVTFLTCLLFIINSISSTPVSENENEEPSDSSDEESGKKLEEEKMEILKEKMLDYQRKNAKKFGIELVSKPEDVEKYLKKEEKEYGEEQLSEIIQEADDGTNDEFNNFARYMAFYYAISYETGDDEEVQKTPAEMEEMKNETYGLMNKLNKKGGMLEISREDFDKHWDEKEKKLGKKFAANAENYIRFLKDILEKLDSETVETTTLEESEASTVLTTESADVIEEEEESSAGAFTLKNAKGKICILAKFKSYIVITYLGKSSEQKVEVTIPHHGHTKGKCEGPNGSSLLQIVWEKFIFSLFFNKTAEDTWGVTLVELKYDTSSPLFDGAAERGNVTVKSKNLSLFETPFGKSYFCPAQEVIFLYHEDKHVATARLKEIHLQPYDVEDAKFSQIHRCSQVVISDPDEEPFVQDETVPFAVGVTLALITLLILVGFSVHRAYNAAKVDYNTME